MNEDIFEPKMVLIEWIDVMSLDAGLLELDDIVDIEPCHAFIIGFLVYESSSCYFVAKECWYDTKQFKYIHVIPKNTAIIKITELVKSNISLNQ